MLHPAHDINAVHLRENINPILKWLHTLFPKWIFWQAFSRSLRVLKYLTCEMTFIRNIVGRTDSNQWARPFEFASRLWETSSYIFEKDEVSFYPFFQLHVSSRQNRFETDCDFQVVSFLVLLRYFSILVTQTVWSFVSIKMAAYRKKSSKILHRELPFKIVELI